MSQAEFYRITPSEYLSFTNKYWAGKFPGKTIGQAFLEEYYPGLTHKTLYTTPDTAKAVIIITDMYIYYGIGDNELEVTKGELNEQSNTQSFV